MLMAAIEPESTTVIIGRMLSPAFMINAAALLLLGLHTKFSTLAARIRALNAERRAIEVPAPPTEHARRENLSRQIHKLAQRLALVRRAIFCHYMGIALFLLTSFLIAVNVFAHSTVLAVLDLTIFTLGMVSVLLGTMSNLREVRTAFHAIRLEAPDAFE
jgi:hypothetical protein